MFVRESQLSFLDDSDNPMQVDSPDDKPARSSRLSR